MHVPLLFAVAAINVVGMGDTSSTVHQPSGCDIKGRTIHYSYRNGVTSSSSLSYSCFVLLADITGIEARSVQASVILADSAINPVVTFTFSQVGQQSNGTILIIHMQAV